MKIKKLDESVIDGTFVLVDADGTKYKSDFVYVSSIVVLQHDDKVVTLSGEKEITIYLERSFDKIKNLDIIKTKFLSKAVKFSSRLNAIIVKKSIDDLINHSITSPENKVEIISLDRIKVTKSEDIYKKLEISYTMYEKILNVLKNNISDKIIGGIRENGEAADKLAYKTGLPGINEYQIAAVALNNYYDVYKTPYGYFEHTPGLLILYPYTKLRQWAMWHDDSAETEHDLSEDMEEFVKNSYLIKDFEEIDDLYEKSRMATHRSPREGKTFRKLIITDDDEK